MVQRVLEKLDGEPIEVFIVWLPAVGGDHFDATENSVKLIPDERVRHYWDGTQALGEAFSPVLELRAKLAWDVYLVFDEAARFGEADGPPAPVQWTHQLIGEDPERSFDEDGLEELIRRELEGE